MKKLLFGTVALVALGLGGMPAKAADMPVYSKAEPLPVWTWAGVYFGAHAGGGWGETHWRHDDFPNINNYITEQVDQKPGGWTVGGQAGMRWQWGAWVFGVEGTAAISDIRANDPACGVGNGLLTCTSVPVVVGQGATLQRDTRIQSLYTATAQLGWAWNRSLWYVKGGWAGADVRLQNTVVGPINPVLGTVCGTQFNNANNVNRSCAGLTRLANGWTLGTGIEYLVLQNLSLGLEYNFMRLEFGDTVGAAAAPSVGNPLINNRIFSDFRADVHQVVARANYRLDWGVLFVPDPAPAPVRARN
jgi:outer membrane immunogenic protein